MITAAEALARLRAGNQRFVAALGAGGAASPRPIALVVQQEPIAIVLGCSDARVPAEIVFDQGLGDLFVIRVAGNIVAPSQIGSVEFAAERFGTRLVVVLGHTSCGGVLATLEALRDPGARTSPGLRSIVDRIRPAIEGLFAAGAGRPQAELVREAVRANVRASVRRLRRGSRILERLGERDGLVIVGAEYSLESGRVEFLDALPAEPVADPRR